MAESDWTTPGGSLTTVDVLRGVTQGYDRPNGGGTFLYGWRAIATTSGVVGLRLTDANFAPIAAGKGGSIRAAIRRDADDDSTVMLGLCLGSDNVTADGYLLGFAEDEQPTHLVLRKGNPLEGIPQGDAANLRESSGTYQKQQWYHVRMDVIVQPHGDVHLQVFENDLDTNPVTAPVWEAVSGMAEFIDDKIGGNSGSAPFTGGGYCGVFFRTYNIGRMGFVDHIEIGRQV